MSYLELAARTCVALVFLISSVGKVIGGVDAFAGSVRDLRVVPRSMVTPVAWLVLAGEFAVWIALAIPTRVSAVFGFTVAAALLAAFAAGIVAAIRRGAAVPCRCFGASSSPLGRRHVVRNIILAGLSIAGAVGSPAAPPSATGVLVAVAAGLLVGALVAMLDDLIGLFLPMPAQQRSVRGL